MIKINNFAIIDGGNSIAIDVETDLGHSITSVLLWSMNDFKDYSKAKDLSYKLEHVNNKEVFIISATEIEISKFKDIYFLEVQSDSVVDDCDTCQSPALGITYNLSQYYNCSLLELLKTQSEQCSTGNSINSQLVITINLLIESVIQSVDLGYYNDAILNVNRLQKLCSINNCVNCNDISDCSTCNKFKQFV